MDYKNHPKTFPSRSKQFGSSFWAVLWNNLKQRECRSKEIILQTFIQNVRESEVRASLQSLVRAWRIARLLKAYLPNATCLCQLLLPTVVNARTDDLWGQFLKLWTPIEKQNGIWWENVIRSRPFKEKLEWHRLWRHFETSDLHPYKMKLTLNNFE